MSDTKLLKIQYPCPEAMIGVEGDQPRLADEALPYYIYYSKVTTSDASLSLPQAL